MSQLVYLRLRKVLSPSRAWKCSLYMQGDSAVMSIQHLMLAAFLEHAIYSVPIALPLLFTIVLIRRTPSVCCRLRDIMA